MEEYTGVTIIPSKTDVIKQDIVMQLGRGITVYMSERGFLKNNFEHHKDCDIVFTVVTLLDVLA